MARVIQPRFRRHVFEAPAAEVLEEMVSVPHRRDEQVGITIVVHVGKRRGHGHLIGKGNSGLVGDVLELPAAQVAVERARAKLRHEVNVQTPVAVHVCHGQPVAVIVMCRLPVFSRVLNDVVLESDAAGTHVVGEMEDSIWASRRLPSMRSNLGSVSGTAPFARPPSTTTKAAIAANRLGETSTLRNCTGELFPSVARSATRFAD